MRPVPEESRLGGTTLAANQASPSPVQQGLSNRQPLETEVVAQSRGPAQAMLDSADGPDGPLMAARAGDGTAASAGPTSTIAEANAEASRARETGQAPTPRIRNFRFLQAAQSARERKLETQYTQLERRLENTNNRMQLSESAMVQIDARLERASLEQDLEMIASEIKRLRLINAFARPVAAPEQVERTQVTAQVAQPAGEASSRSEPAASDRTQILNLLA